MPCMSETVGHGVKGNKMWDSGTLAEHLWGTFNLGVVSVILWSFGAFVSNWHLTRGAKQTETYDSVTIAQYIWGTFVS